MSLRVCLVSPFAWSQPHDVNEHVAGVAAGLRRLGHHVTVLAPSSRTADLLAGRRALLDGADAEVIALGPALPVSRRSRVGVPVGVRANLSLALAVGRYDVVHGFEPGLPSLSYLALRDAQALAVATFLSPERLGYPPGRSQRERLLGRVDALVATSEETAEAAATRFPGEYTVVSPGVDLELFRPGEKRRLAVLEWRPTERPLARAVIRALREVPDWELILLRTKTLAGRPYRPASLRDRIHVRTARDGRARAPIFGEASIVVPALTGLQRVPLEAAAAGAAIAAPRAMREQPELAAAELEGLGAIAVTDHNALGGALEAVELARGRDLVVVPGEEVKTDGQGEVIGLFLSEEIPRGLSFADTIAAIRAQGGLVYLPHPFDRLHAIPDAPTLHRHLADIDVFEVYNARLLFDAYNDEALRFATKYNLTMGAGSDAHVLQGLGTGVLRMRTFEGPEEFLISLRSAQVLRRPKSLVYLQSLKWVAQAKERVR